MSDLRAQMPSTKSAGAPVFFASAAEFRAWLGAHANTACDLTVGFYKVSSGRSSLTWPESVDEALCVGWIDGVRKRVDEQAYQIRFTPRRQGSIWSTVNVTKVEALIAQGRMKPAGLAAYRQKVERKTGVYSYEQEDALKLAPEELQAFKRDKAAWAFFQKTPPSYRRTMIHWLVSAKQSATRARRLAKFIGSCAAGVRLLP
jgi:uncharacterized protein YdeI (YjbR/CyaY-like superfamily)